MKELSNIPLIAAGVFLSFLFFRLLLDFQNYPPFWPLLLFPLGLATASFLTVNKSKKARNVQKFLYAVIFILFLIAIIYLVVHFLGDPIHKPAKGPIPGL